MRRQHVFDNGPNEIRADRLGVKGEVEELIHAAGGEAHVPDVATVYGGLGPMTPGFILELVGVVLPPLELE